MTLQHIICTKQGALWAVRQPMVACLMVVWVTDVMRTSMCGHPMCMGWSRSVHTIGSWISALNLPPSQVRNEKARRFLNNLEPKTGMPFHQLFPGMPNRCLSLLKRYICFYYCSCFCYRCSLLLSLLLLLLSGLSMPCPLPQDALV